MSFTSPDRRRARSWRQSRPGGDSAFTLVEIMIAIAIFGVLVAAIYATWTLILRSKQVGNEAAAQVQRQRIAVRTIEDSLMCVQSFQASLSYYSFIVQNGDQPMLSFVARVPAVFPRNGRFGDFNLRRLTFTLEPGADGGKNLVLRQNPLLMDVDSDEQSYPLVLAHNVQDFVVECLDTNNQAWIGEWDDTNSIPPIIRVTLALGGTSDSRNGTPGLVITRAIATPSMMLPSFLQTPRSGGGGGPGGPGPGGPGPGGPGPGGPHPGGPGPGGPGPGGPHPGGPHPGSPGGMQ